MKVFLMLPLLAFAASCGPSVDSSADTHLAEAKASPAVKPAFDVPSLLFSNAKDLKKELGKPISESALTALQIKAGATRDIEFVRDSTHLVATCDPGKRGRVTEIFVSFREPTKDIAALLAATNLQENRLRYKLKPVQMLADTRFYTGVIVIPQRHIVQ